MADFYTFNVFEMNRDGTKDKLVAVNLDNVLTVEKIDIGTDENAMEVLLIDGTTFKAYYHEEFVADMGRTIHG
tara:strand:+ start:80 stop:298 length:219 start_codon:yes stop_codon:yes gene_type:complete